MQVSEGVQPGDLCVCVCEREREIPHNANLAVWRKKDGLSSSCKLCGERQTLMNHCRVALELRRYNERHDKVLREIAAFVKENLPESYEVIADLPGSLYTFPAAITPTDQ